MTNQAAVGVTREGHAWRHRIPLVLIILLVGIPLALIVFAASPRSTDFGYVLIGIPCLYLIWIVVVSWSAVLYFRSARREWWKLRHTLAVLSVAVVVSLLSFFPVIWTCNYVGAAARFAMTRSYYDDQVALLPADDKPRIAVFNWGGMIWSSTGIVYDESDEVALPPGKQSAAWKANRYLANLSCGNFDAHRLWSHYYYVAFPC